MSLIHGITFTHHSYSITQVDNGEVTYALEEEKVSGIKNHLMWYEMPFRSALKLKQLTQKSLKDSDIIAITDASILVNYYHTQFKDWGDLEADKTYSWNKFFSELKGTKAKIKLYEHHQSHAASSYYTSGFDKALVITSDGGSFEGEVGTIWLGNNKELVKVNSQNLYFSGASISNLYFLICDYFGFIPLKDEGKIMGMAGHGEYNEYVYNSFKSILSYVGNLTFSPFDTSTRTQFVYDRLKDEGWFSTQKNKEIVAFNLQKYLEDQYLLYLKDVHEMYPEYRNICFAGGMFANVKLTQKINESGLFDQVYVFPAMGDEGISYGAAILASLELGEYTPSKLKNAFLGYEISNEEIEQEASKYPTLNKLPFSYKIIAELLNDGKIVALFQGRFEYGPRALGSRSIMVRATDTGTHELLNQRLKRNEIMPFAPFVLGEEAHNVFDIPSSEHTAEFMTICYTAKDEWVEKIPAVIHRVDNTGRPQLVYQENNPVFWNILNEYNKLSGIPVLLNTSFNGHGEPIIAHPDRAFYHLNEGTIDYLVIGNFIYYK